MESDVDKKQKKKKKDKHRERKELLESSGETETSALTEISLTDNRKSKPQKKKKSHAVPQLENVPAILESKKSKEKLTSPRSRSHSKGSQTSPREMGPEIQEVFYSLRTSSPEQMDGLLQKIEPFLENTDCSTLDHSLAVLSPVLTNLIAALHNSTSQLKIRIFKVLRKLLASKLLRNSFMECGGPSAVLKLLVDEDKELQQVAIGSLAYMLSTETTDEFCKAGAVTLLLELLPQLKDTAKCGAQVIAALWTLTFSSEMARDEVRELKGLPILFNIIRESNDEFIQEQALDILENMCGSTQNQNEIRLSGGFELLKEVLRINNPTLNRKTCSTLTALIASNSTNKKYFEEKKLAKKMVELIYSKADRNVRVAAARTLKEWINKSERKVFSDGEGGEDLDAFLVMSDSERNEPEFGGKKIVKSRSLRKYREWLHPATP